MLKFSYYETKAVTTSQNPSLLLNNQLFIHQFKSFIMRKTLLTFAMACLVGTSAVMANDTITTTDASAFEMYDTVELNSFCKAIMQGDIDVVKKLIELGEDVNKKSLGMTPAIFAARYNKAEILELLIDNGANLKIKSDKGYSISKYAELSNASEALRVIETAMGS